MAESEIITALDVGSGRVTCVIAAYDGDAKKVRVLGGARAESKGLKSGMVTHIGEAARSIAQAVEAAEKVADQVASGVVLGVRGPHLHSLDVRGRLPIARSDREITADDVVAVMEDSRAFNLDHGTEILHLVPQKFSLDGLPGVPDPVGMQGRLLEAEAHIVMGSSPAINNLVKAVETAGFSLACDPVCTLLALGELVLEEEEKTLGALLVDIGGQTTSLGIYAEGALHFFRELPVGGDNISKDLAHALGTTAGWARELKEKYGAVYSALVDKTRKIPIMKADRRTRAEVTVADLLKCIQPRVEESLEEIYAAVQKTPYTDLAAGVVVAGGGALLRGMPDAAKEIIEVPQARLAAPAREGLDCPAEYLAQPYLGAVALACYPHLKTWKDYMQEPREPGLLDKAMKYIASIF